jgi:Tol biopolymer transport system component
VRVLALLAAAVSVQLATVSPDGGTRFVWSNPMSSASIAMDGLPLVAEHGSTSHVLIGRMLPFRDYLSWCGSTLVAVAGGDRETTLGKRLVLSRAPYERTRPLTRDASLSWVDPACAPDGRSVVAAASRNAALRFGQEHRSLWRLSLDGRTRTRLTRPPKGRSDEAPCFSGDSRTLYFVRSGPTTASGLAAGRMYALDLATRKLRPLERLAPVANTFGHYAWPVNGRCGG